LDVRILHLIATVIEFCDPPREGARGHPPAETIRVLAALRRFLREGTPWRSLTATAAQVSGSTLRRWLTRWARIGLLAHLLAQVHAVLVGMLRGHPDLILDSCSVRAKRGGDCTGPNPTDRAKRGPKYNVAVDGSRWMGTACRSRVWQRPPMSMTRWSSSGCSGRPLPSWRASGPCSRTKGMTPSLIARCVACLAPDPGFTSVGSHPAQGWASAAGPSSAATPGCWRRGAWRSAMTGSASSSSRCSKPHVSSWLQDASLANSENYL
jgi:hypothetical protein